MEDFSASELRQAIGGVTASVSPRNRLRPSLFPPVVESDFWKNGAKNAELLFSEQRRVDGSFDILPVPPVGLRCGKRKVDMGRAEIPCSGIKNILYRSGPP